MTMRGNNPGNMRRWGSNPVVNGFAVFPSVAAGLSAQRDQLRLYGKRGINNIQKIVNTWAPSADNNNVAAYIATVTKLSGYNEHQVLDLMNPLQIGRLMFAMINQEQGGFPLSQSLLKTVVGMTADEPLTGKLPAPAMPPPAKPYPGPASPVAAKPAPAPTPAPAAKEAPAANVAASTVVLHKPAPVGEVTVGAVKHPTVEEAEIATAAKDLEVLTPADRVTALQDAEIQKT